MRRTKQTVLVAGLVLVLALGVWVNTSQSSLTTDWWRAILHKYFDSWSRHDLEMHMDCFAGRVNFYGQSLTRDQLRNYLEPVFNQNQTRLISFSRIHVGGPCTFSAVISCDRQWYYFGRPDRLTCDKSRIPFEEQVSCGKARTRFGMVCEKGAWKIRSVTDTKIYWMSNDPEVCKTIHYPKPPQY